MTVSARLPHARAAGIHADVLAQTHARELPAAAAKRWGGDARHARGFAGSSRKHQAAVGNAIRRAPSPAVEQLSVERPPRNHMFQGESGQR